MRNCTPDGPLIMNLIWLVCKSGRYFSVTLVNIFIYFTWCIQLKVMVDQICKFLGTRSQLKGLPNFPEKSNGFVNLECAHFKNIFYYD